MTFYAGFDIGGTNARVSLYDASWKAVAQMKARIRETTAPEQIVDTMEEMLVEVLTKADASPRDLEAVGVGLAGQMSKDGRVVINAPNLGWRDVAFAELLEERLAADFGLCRVRVVNDLSALLWGEHLEGAVQGCPEVLAVYVGTGIGGAILAEGHLLAGAGGKAGEIGHSKVVVGGRLCGCGERGCVEAYAGGVHLEQQVALIAHEHGIAEVFVGEDEERVDLAVADRFSEEVGALDGLWSQVTDYLALILANACTLLNPGVLLLGGGVLNNCPSFRSRTLMKTTPLVLAAARDDLEIRFPSLGDEAGMLGAARLAQEA